MAAKVFISHSHRDRGTAVVLAEVLEENGIERFLDQDQIEAGDVLPDRLVRGVEWCDKVLLLWSASAARSRWVDGKPL
jgi:hypothetical protein